MDAQDIHTFREAHETLDRVSEAINEAGLLLYRALDCLYSIQGIWDEGIWDEGIQSTQRLQSDSVEGFHFTIRRGRNGRLSIMRHSPGSMPTTSGKVLIMAGG